MKKKILPPLLVMIGAAITLFFASILTSPAPFTPQYAFTNVASPTTFFVIFQTNGGGPGLNTNYYIYTGNFLSNLSSGALTNTFDANFTLINGTNVHVSATPVFTNATFTNGMLIKAPVTNLLATPSTPAEWDSARRLTNAAVAVAAGTYGDSTHIVQLQFDASGVPTGAVAVAVSGIGSMAVNPNQFNTNSSQLNLISNAASTNLQNYRFITLNGDNSDVIPQIRLFDTAAASGSKSSSIDYDSGLVSINTRPDNFIGETNLVKFYRDKGTLFQGPITNTGAFYSSGSSFSFSQQLPFAIGGKLTVTGDVGGSGILDLGTFEAVGLGQFDVGLYTTSETNIGPAWINSLVVTNGITNQLLTASRPVVTDGNKALASGALIVTTGNGASIINASNAAAPIFKSLTNGSNVTITDNGTNISIAASGGGGGTITSNVYTSGANTFTNSGFTTIHVIMFGAGGGGGGGSVAPAATSHEGGAGGGGASRVEAWFAASELPATITCTVGAGGAGGGGFNGAVGNGTNGSAGANTTFGTNLTAYGGGGGSGGWTNQTGNFGGGGAGTAGPGVTGSATTGGTGGPPGVGTSFTAIGGQGAAANLGNQAPGCAEYGGGGGGAVNGSYAGGSSLFGGSGGGASSCEQGGSIVSSPKTGGLAQSYVAGGGGAAGADSGTTPTAGGAGAPGTAAYGGQGGGGGGSSLLVNGAVGGAGGACGGGGGGGGFSSNAVTGIAAAGGAGGAGRIYIFAQ